MIMRGQRLLLMFVSIFFPMALFADPTQSMSLTPPASDISVVFLGNLFGLVDGVLHGSGSQIMGVIFSTFNSAVLALGGIVMMYIILVSTMNTAHEGQMLGQKWSSIWVPVRATTGLALLIPKSSGYCLMQIFVMWVVVQGVGVADKVWGTALDYLNRGGVIIHAQVDPNISRGAGGQGNNSVISGAGVILYGQVCMLALQTQLENQRKLDLDAKKEDAGPCSGTPSGVMKDFCTTAVPDFLSTVDPLREYSAHTDATPPPSSYTIPMPNFKTGPYAALDGICGQLSWSALDTSILEAPVAISDPKPTQPPPSSRQGSGWGGGFTKKIKKAAAQQREEESFRGNLMEEEEEEVAAGADELGAALQHSMHTAKTEGLGELYEAHAINPNSPAGEVYAKWSAKKSYKSAKKTTKDTRDSQKKRMKKNWEDSLAKKTLDGTVKTSQTIKKGSENTYKQVKKGTENTIKQMKKMMPGGGGGGGGGAGGGFDGKGGFSVKVEGASAISKKSFLVSAPSTAAATTPFTLSAGDLEIIKKSRAAAVEQMMIVLASTAKAIVGNDPEITPSGSNPDEYASRVADYQFGVPETASRAACMTMSADCPYWGKLGESSPVLLDGTELQDATIDYNAVMKPALKLLSDAQDRKKLEGGRAFMTDARRSGWILAGSYFFHLVQLNGSATAMSKTVDSESGLGKSEFDLEGVSGYCGSSSSYRVLCDFFSESTKPAEQIVALFMGPNHQVSQQDLSSGSLKRIPDASTTVSSETASTVYGYANNAMLIDLPGQPGVQGPQMKFGLDELKVKITSEDIGDRSACSKFNAKCIGQQVAKALWNNIGKPVVNNLMKYMAKGATYFINYAIIWPLDHFIGVFEDGIKTIAKPGVNPVLALATMGVHYINFAMDTWMLELVTAIALSFLPSTFAIIMMAMPLLTVWLGLMVGIGFVTAYYIPFLPYMIFTFGAIAWFIAVVEAMAAAPLVALGIAHPEGHDALGKSEQGLMILLNVFLRPAMMVIGFIASIAMCYVGVWLLNAGFSNVLGYLDSTQVWGARRSLSEVSLTLPWAKIFGFFFAILIYTTTYLTIVEKAFSLIAVLPDKVLRWIGGQPEGIGGEAMQWTSEVKGKVDKAADTMDRAMGAMQKQMAEGATGIGKDLGKAKAKIGSWLPSSKTKSTGGS